MKKAFTRTVQTILVVIAAAVGIGATCLHFPSEDLNGDHYWDSEPLQWSPEGDTIIAGISGTIYEVGVDRVEVTPIHKYSPREGAHSPSLSPSGDRIVYSRKVTDEEAPGWPKRMLFISNVDGTDETLVSEEIHDGRAPSWSPDGRTIAFKQFDSKLLATISPDGSNLKTLAEEIRVQGTTLPVWSPDSSRIAFVGIPAEEEKQKGVPHIYTVAKDGSSLTKVGESAATAPGWSPDGKAVVYGEVDKGAPHQKSAVVIHQVAVDGSQTIELFRSARANPLLPRDGTTWTPSTGRILFSGNSIAVLDIETGILTSYEARIAVPADRLDLTRTAVSPDGMKLATLVTTSISPKNLIVMDLDGNNKRSLMTWDPREMEPKATNETWIPEAPFSWEWIPIPVDGCPPDANCDSRNVSGSQITAVRPTVAAFDYERETPTVEELLELGLRAGGASPTHIAVRATMTPDSVRCQHRPVARTITQREQAIRYWLNLGEDAELPTPEEIQRTVTNGVATADGAFQPVLKASFIPIARGGANDEYQFLACYADFAVTEYLLGTGPTLITVAYDKRTAEPTMSYDLYKEAHDNGYFGNQPLMTPAEHQAETDRTVAEAQRSLNSILDSRNAVIFLSPMAAHHTIAVEAWQAIAQWELQTDEQGTLLAVRYGVATDHDEYSQTLANLSSRITAGASSDSFADTRIASVSGLNYHYRSIGAYDDITPGDDSDETFMPAMPPPVPTCAGSAAVGADPDQGLVDDCNALLDAKATLAGAAALNWSKDTAMSSWDGIRLGGNPRRVQMLLLTDKDLDGSIPAMLGNLAELRRIDLDENELTGPIPPQLGMLKKLTHLYTLRQRAERRNPAGTGHHDRTPGPLPGRQPTGRRHPVRNWEPVQPDPTRAGRQRTLGGSAGQHRRNLRAGPPGPEGQRAHRADTPDPQPVPVRQPGALRQRLHRLFAHGAGQRPEPRPGQARTRRPAILRPGLRPGNYAFSVPGSSPAGTLGRHGCSDAVGHRWHSGLRHHGREPGRPVHRGRQHRSHHPGPGEDQRRPGRLHPHRGSHRRARAEVHGIGISIPDRVKARAGARGRGWSRGPEEAGYRDPTPPKPSPTPPPAPGGAASAHRRRREGPRPHSVRRRQGHRLRRIPPHRLPGQPPGTEAPELPTHPPVDRRTLPVFFKARSSSPDIESLQGKNGSLPT